MHDTISLETEGLPGLFVASREFESAATHQARSLGADPAGVFVEHPIQDRTDGEMEAIAEDAFQEVLAALLS